MQFRFILLICLLAAAFAVAHGQQRKKLVAGKVSYKSAENVYVAFSSAKGIAPGDTLFYISGNDTLPGILVKFASSKSAAGTSLKKTVIELGEVFIAYVAADDEPVEVAPVIKVTAADSAVNVPASPSTARTVAGKELYGRTSVQAFSAFDNSGSTSGTFTRYRYTMSLYADDYQGTGLGFSFYSTLARSSAEPGIFGSSIAQNLRVYDLSVSYKIDSLSAVSGGRYMNPRIASAGAVDGIQYERNLGGFFGGAFVGSRPGMSDYGYDLKLLQYGVYAGRVDEFSSGNMENDLAFFQQMYNGTTDRRFLYLQHTNNLLPSASMFLSSELDLYTRDKGVPKNNLSFTGIFYTLRLRPWNSLSISASYDARKNVLYYESYKSSIDSLITKELRQGYRLTLAWQPVQLLYIGVNGGYRFQPSDPRPSKTAGVYCSYQDVPVVGGAVSLAYNNLTGSFLVGNTYAASWYVDVAEGLQCALTGKRNYYTIPRASLKVAQDLLGADIAWFINRSFTVTVSYEGMFEQKNAEGRIFSDVSFRF